MKIFKFQIPLSDVVTIEMQENAKILSVQAQNEKPYMWALVDPPARLVKRKFRFAGTGHEITHDSGKLLFIGTFQMHGGSLVFHIFEILE